MISFSVHITTSIEQNFTIRHDVLNCVAEHYIYCIYLCKNKTVGVNQLVGDDEHYL